MHAFHGFDPQQRLLSLGLRDPNDAQVLRANGNNYVIAQCARGSKQVNTSSFPLVIGHLSSMQVVPQQFHRWAMQLQPDIIFALPDIPCTSAPYSQKRLTKSNERSTRWLTDLVILREKERSHPPVMKMSDASMTTAMSGPAIFTHLVGGSALAARDAFAENLLEPLSGRDADLLPKLDSIDEAVSGYILDLVPIRLSSSVSLGRPAHPRAPLPDETMTPMIHASLRYLSEQKPRLATGASTPHEILRLINSSGIDLFDSSWAQRAADHGVALDFRFPVGNGLWSESQVCGFARRSAALNLYDPRFATDFSRLSGDLMSAQDAHQAQRGKKVDEDALEKDGVLVCKCIACSPEVITAPIAHSDTDVLKGNSAEGEMRSSNNRQSKDTMTIPSDTQSPLRHFSRAYLHHLLHTHEMSAHTFLTAHNLAVLDAFFSGIRSTMAKTHDPEALGQSDASAPARTLFQKEFARFEHIYDESLLWGTSHSDSSGNIAPAGKKATGILEEAEQHWREVDYLRGKGRFKREKEAALVAATEDGGDTASVEPTKGSEVVK